MRPSAHDWFGHAVGLQFAICELHTELTTDVIQANPRLVLMAIAGLEAKANLLIAAMKSNMEQFQEVKRT
jgi:hypothetical protein